MQVSTVMSLPHLLHPSGSILDDTAFTAASKFSPFLLALSPQVFLTWLISLSLLATSDPSLAYPRSFS